MSISRVTLTLALVLGPLTACAQNVDPASLYSISTEGSSGRIKSGETGVFILNVQSKSGAHVSSEAPLRIALLGKHLTPEKAELTAKDSVAAQVEGGKPVDPRFQVALRAALPGPGAIEARLTFFICTETLCARQQKLVSLPIEVY